MLASAPFLSATPAVATATASAIQPMVVPTPTQQVHLTQKELIEKLKEQLPSEVRVLTNEEEQVVAQTLSSSFHMSVSPQLNGMRLNRSYGLIGQEQHLRRFPGDTLEIHFETAEDAQKYAVQGIAPGLGAWGYFTNDNGELTKEGIEQEKYYIAVQTFLSPGWNQHVGEYGMFFKHRKMLLVNPENGKALIADIADAGPADWTGKHLGGSPEVMRYLERVDGAQRGPVLYFFVDDPSDTIPLGPTSL